MYSREKVPLQSISFVTAVFKFSHIWDIEALTEVLYEFLNSRISVATDTFAVLDLFVELGLKEEQRWCCQVSAGSSFFVPHKLKI
jgi:hypothetical protein